MAEINYDASSKMYGPFPEIRKLGAVSPNGESSPFVWQGRLMRLELVDPSHGTDSSMPARAIIRDWVTGEVLSSFGEGCYYFSFYQEHETAYVLGTLSKPGALCGDTIVLFESRDLRNWTSRPLLTSPGWQYFNTSLTRGDQGYVLLMEANEPRQAVGEHPFTLFFASSDDLIHWTMMGDELGFSKERYMGGPYMRFSNGWYYLISVTELPCARYTNYIYRTRDFRTWYVGLYNPILMPDNEDRKLSAYAFDFSPEALEQMKTGFISNNSDIDLCEYQGKTILTYNVGNQLGFYYMAAAEYDGTPDEFLEAYFR